VETFVLETVYNSKIEINQLYVFSSCGWRDLRDMNVKVNFSSIMLDKTSKEPDQKGKVFVDATFQIRKKRAKLPKEFSSIKRSLLTEF